MLAYVVGYLVMPASGAERRLLSDVVTSGASLVSRRRLLSRRMGDHSSMET